MPALFWVMEVRDETLPAVLEWEPLPEVTAIVHAVHENQESVRAIIKLLVNKFGHDAFGFIIVNEYRTKHWYSALDPVLRTELKVIK
jgi:hypothetical protein